MNAVVVATTTPSNDPQVSRVVVVPSLWAPFHHQPAVAALAMFTKAVQPDRIVFMNAPDDRSMQAHEAFMNIIAAFRAAYGGPITVHSSTEQRTVLFARLNVAVLPESAIVTLGWRAASGDLHAQSDLAAHAATTGDNVVCAGTGRLRLTGRATPASGGVIRAWLVFECGTLAADSAAGTLGFGILETDQTTTTARPVRVGADGSFTYRGTRYKGPV